MPFCPSCGSQVSGSFCATCGKPVGAAPSGPTMQAQAAGLDDNVASALCYVLGLITGILFLVLEPYSKNPAIRFHAFQSIFLNLACIGASIVVDAVLDALHLDALYPLVTLALLGLAVYTLVQAYQGKTIVLPVIGPLAQAQARR
jgi:uncharacterized membrane protein